MGNQLPPCRFLAPKATAAPIRLRHLPPQAGEGKQRVAHGHDASPPLPLAERVGVRAGPTRPPPPSAFGTFNRERGKGSSVFPAA